MGPDVLSDAIDQLQIAGAAKFRLPANTAHRANAAVSAAFEFFRLPLDQKQRAVFPDECGFRQLGIEYSSSPERPDQIESFSISGRMLATDRSVSPDEVAVLLEAMLALFSDMQLTAERIALGLAESIAGMDVASSLTGSLKRWSRLQVNYSRPSGVAQDLIHDVHEDGSFITVAGATAPGLELLTPAGDFEPATTAPDEVVIMAGEIASLLSGGLVRPRYHRVRPEPHCDERLAYLFFADIAPDKCRPWLSTALNRDIDIAARVRTNVRRFGLSGFEQEG